MVYAEHFRIAPHEAVQSSARWYRRWRALEHFRALRDAKEYVEKHGLSNATKDTKALFNEITFWLRENG